MTNEQNYHTQSVLSVEYKVNFRKVRNGKRTVGTDKGTSPKAPESSGKLPRITRLLALAHHLQGLIDQGIVADYADIARLSGLSRARVTQIMNLTLLAPQIQEEIIDLANSKFLYKINDRVLRRVFGTPLWENQLVIWGEVKLSKRDD